MLLVYEPLSPSGTELSFYGRLRDSRPMARDLFVSHVLKWVIAQLLVLGRACRPSNFSRGVHANSENEVFPLFCRKSAVKVRKSA